ncbi:hypothetical protein L2E82_16389 [Cichorium intybus]|uniref:Uncharacterized protein n=1 Tax=Cichorium intybus TaxID=13427 RepID=A0ACB9F5E4_CICIN|nr:hypothetical protein L2E82_16389 [Cichorium intybus]
MEVPPGVESVPRNHDIASILNVNNDGFNVDPTSKLHSDPVIGQSSEFGPVIGPGSDFGNVETENGKTGPTGSPLNYFGASSPDFEQGDSAIKRRRTKKKERNFRTGFISQQPGAPRRSTEERPSPSIDLNRVTAENSSTSHVKNSSPTHSMTSYSREFEQVIDVGKKVGFQIGRDNSSLIGAVNGGGVKHG